MSGEFRVYGEPKLRYTNDGIPVANVRLVCNKRKKNAQGAWEDDPEKVLWANASLWRKPAENLMNSIRDKDLVIVTGTFYHRKFVHDGVEKYSVEIEAEHIAPSLTFRSTPHSDQPPQQGQQAPPQGQQQPAYAPQQGQWPAQPPQPTYAQQGHGYAPGSQPESGWPGGGSQPPF
jgi:single-strand DNA-binding protein